MHIPGSVSEGTFRKNKLYFAFIFDITIVLAAVSSIIYPIV